MGSPYTSVSVSNYNLNPPSDDGSQTPANKVLWATHKTKLGDPLKTAIESINTNIVSALGKLVGGAGVTAVSDDYTVLATDQGKLVKLATASKTITTPSAATVDDPFVFAVLNASTGDITLDGSSDQTIDGKASITIRAGGGCFVFTDGTNWFTAGQNFSRTMVQPQGYLTPTSATPVIASDVSEATAIYYTPDKGDLIPIPDGTTFEVREFSELTLTLNSNHTAGSIYDVFAFSDSGTLRIGTGPAWNTATAGSGARGTGAGTTELARLKGLFTNANSMTARNGSSTYTVATKCGLYLGSIYMDSSAGKVTCHRSYGQSRKWGIWNAYNRRPIILQVGDSTASWTYTTNSYRQSNGATGNKGTAFMGLAEELVEAEFRQNFTASNDIGRANIGIGVNSTSAPTGMVGVLDFSAGGTEGTVNLDSLAARVTASHVAAPALGLTDLNCLEEGGSNVTFNGGNDDMLMTIEYMG